MVTASPTQEIVINNIGPIDQLRIPIDPQGGCTILRGKNGAWESLDPSNRQIVANAARKYRVQVITAEAAEGELRAESYNESELEKVAG